jgi:hypothetical protein
MASERDRLAHRARMAEEAAEQAAERERIEAPIRAATEQAQELHRKIYQITRDRIASGLDEDEFGRSLVYCTPGLEGLEVPQDYAVRYVVAEYRDFVKSAAWYYDAPANRTAVFSYLQRNGFPICDQTMLERAARRLSEFDLLEARPAPEPEPERPFVNLRIEQPPAPQTFEGWDDETGEPRVFTKRQVDHMSSEEYLRAFRLGRTFGSGAPLRNVTR